MKIIGMLKKVKLQQSLREWDTGGRWPATERTSSLTGLAPGGPGCKIDTIRNNFMPSSFRSGFAAIRGRPNVGKCTLTNRLVGHKVSIVTSRPQTTRTRILGIVNHPDAQLVLIDTPGIHRDPTALGRQMNAEISQALEGIDVLAVMIDASQGLKRADLMAFERAGHFAGPAILLLNKIDRMAKPALLPLLEACSRQAAFTEMIPLSAASGDGVARGLNRFLAY